MGQQKGTYSVHVFRPVMTLNPDPKPSPNLRQTPCHVLHTNHTHGGDI